MSSRVRDITWLVNCVKGRNTDNIPGILKSSTTLPLVRGHVLDTEGLSALNASLQASGLDALPDDAMAIAMGYSQETQRKAVMVLVAVLLTAYCVAGFCLAKGVAEFRGGLMFVAVFVTLFASLAIFTFAYSGPFVRRWYILEPNRLRLWRQFGAGLGMHRAVPYAEIRELRYERGGGNERSGVSLLLESCEWLHLVGMDVQNATLSNNNAGCFARALSKISGMPITGDILEDGLGRLDAPFVMPEPSAEPALPPARVPTGENAEGPRADPGPPGYEVFASESALSSLRGGFWMFVKPSFVTAVRRRNPMASGFYLFVALLLAVWILNRLPAYRGWFDAAVWDAFFEQIREMGLEAIPNYVSGEFPRRVVPMIAAPLVGLVCLVRAGFYAFRKYWLVLSDKRFLVYANGFLRQDRLVNIPKSEIVEISHYRDSEHYRLAVVRDRKRPWRLPWVRTDEEAEWLGAILKQWAE